MSKGFIYIFTNPALSGMVKIGYANDVERRRKELSTTALPYEYEVFATYETNGNLEDKKLHRLIDNLNPDLRVSKNREFFIMKPEEAYELLETIAIISGTKDKLKRYVSADETTRRTVRRPLINFTECGIPVGAVLVSTDNPTQSVTVVSDRKVEYKNEITSLTAVAKQIKGCTHAVQGPRHFTYNGKIVSDIYNETQGKQK